jgi:putative transcriptional regulator
MDSLAGKLLIAVPELGDSNFFRSVVLVFQHDNEGAAGVILNRPSNMTIGKVWDQIAPEIECLITDPVYVGGPVPGPLMALHNLMTYSDNEILPGLYLTMEREKLNSLVHESERKLRIFSGYAGWGPNQLEGEMDVGGWLTLSADATHAFDPPDELWRKVCEQVGHKIMLPRVSKTGKADPNLN